MSLSYHLLMRIGFDSSPCSLSLKTEVCSTTKRHQNKSDLKKVFVQKSFSAKSDFEHQLLSKAIQNEQSLYKKIEVN